MNLKVAYLEDIRELDKGLLTGMKKVDAYKKYPNYVDVDDISVKYPNGESMQDLYNRVVSYIDNFNDDNCLIVTHRGVINMIYYYCNNIPLSMDKEKFGVIYASIHKLDKKAREITKIF